MPDKHPILIFNDIKFEQLKAIVAFIYNGSVNVSENNIHAFLNAAQSLLIKGLSEEVKEEGRNGENMRKITKNDSNFNVRKINAKPPPIKKPEFYSELGKNFKKQKHIFHKPEGHFVECEESLSKLQEISFTKYVHQNLNSKPLIRTDNITDHKWNGCEEKLRPPENYIVKSWKHNSVEDLNGKHKQNKNNFIKKIKLEKPVITRTEEPEKTEKTENTNETDVARNCQKYPSKSEVSENKIKKKVEQEEVVLVEPKQEVMEEDDTNLEDYENIHSSNTDTEMVESENIYDNKTVGSFYQQPVVDRGVPVPLLMCRTSLSEPQSVEPTWMPHIVGSIQSDHPSHINHPDINSPDMQCRACTQDLPCPTCTKKYKSRYALNRHILYECGKARKSFSCDECGKKVTRQDTLQKHKLIHLVQHLKKKENEESTEAKSNSKK